MAAELTAVLFALRRESLYFRRSFPSLRACPGPCRAHHGGAVERPVLLVETGIGAARVAAALDWLLSVQRPARLLFAGFAGALSETVQVGDVVWATEVADVGGACWPITWTGVPPAALPRGRLLTAPHMIGAPAEKRALGREQRALAVDMESALFARRCSEQGLPFGCVRAVSDAVDTALSPVLVSLLAGGAASAWRLSAALARRPLLLGELLRLARDTKLASRRLGEVLAGLL